MKWFLLLLLFFHASLSVKHSLKYFITASSGVPHFPSFVEVMLVDDALVGYCDSDRKLEELKQEWMQQLLRDEPGQWSWYRKQCWNVLPKVFRDDIETLKQDLNQSTDVHILQRLSGCEWDDQTEETSGFWQFGFNGEDLISLDLQTLTWVTPRPEALITKRRWDSYHTVIAEIEHDLTHFYPSLLKKYVNYGRGYLLRTVPPSVSLLQKSPSSPISCFATGFYPNRADMFWRRDGEQTHEDVDHGEILPNPDGTFQMRVDLDLSSVTAQDWSRYECVFKLSGVKDIITRLDRAEIRTNEGNSMSLIIVIVAVVLVALVAVIGFIVYRKRNAKRPPCPVHECGVLEQLSPEVQTQQLEPRFLLRASSSCCGGGWCRTDAAAGRRHWTLHQQEEDEEEGLLTDEDFRLFIIIIIIIRQK
ncbi:major histocompatibility complex class I-related gene protein-like isoform X6 [Betta splendens]|uniref:Major histocompatibility complex class I-related gene protein-like isoform X6 n=1 Tax=Betta splendens TaxID=158456 RepID=A0A9W2Y424_BETSP|nr:major histocompatibility complex class I-related gene protein-like isoform X6 [Betta splendens]